MQLPLLRLLLQLPPLPPQQPLPSPPPTQSPLNISNARPQPFSEMVRSGKNLRWSPVVAVAIPPADAAVAASSGDAAVADDQSSDDDERSAGTTLTASTTRGNSFYTNSDAEDEASGAPNITTHRRETRPTRDTTPLRSNARMTEDGNKCGTCETKLTT